jgi:hypothetical protein
MLFNKPLIFLLLILCSAFSSQMAKPQLSKWIVMKGGSLRVNGSTNINKFNCVIANYAKPDTLTILKSVNKGPLQLNGSIKLDVQNFDCHNPVMTSDLRKTLKVKDHPKLVIRFLSLSKYPDLDSRPDVITGTVAIELAGVSKRFEVDYKIAPAGDDIITMI